MFDLKRITNRFLYANTEKSVTGAARLSYLDDVWEMYQLSYASIGTHLPSPRKLLKYDIWLLTFNREQRPNAFALFKTTPFGMKFGLGGSDGSPDGKAIIKRWIRAKLQQSGYYAEVSHKVEFLASSAPVVCVQDVPKVLGKPIIPQGDGIHYARVLGEFGKVVKKMVGRPRGVPSGNPERCREDAQKEASRDSMEREMVALREFDTTGVDDEMLYELAEHATQFLYGPDDED